MPRDDKAVNDGFGSLSGGMQSGISPSVINPNQVAYGVNVTFRGGIGGATRPKFRKIPINWQGTADPASWFNEHGISGGAYYNPPSGEELLVGCAGGRYFSFKIAGNKATAADITPPSPSGVNRTTTWFCQATPYLVGNNGVDAAFIYDGSTSRNSDPSKQEVPTGKQMAFLNYRLAVVLPDGRQIAFGDLQNGPTSVINFTEVLQPPSQGGGYLSIPLEAGEITALVPTAQLDLEAGQGTLLAATRTTVCSFNPVVQRANWPSIQLESISLIGNGFTSQNCAAVNGDVWGRSLDGWRSYVMARRQFGIFGNTAQSQEIERILALESPNLLENVSYVFFDNRLLGTVLPARNGPTIYHNGIVAIDFQNTASLTTKASPCYDGLWTGIKPYQIIVGKFAGQERCFAFCYEGPGQNGLWEITRESGDDNDDTGGTPTRIPCVLESKSFSFSSPALTKQIQDGEVWVDSLRGQVDFQMRWRPDQFPCWFDWLQWTETAKDNNCDERPLDPFACQTPETFADQYRPRMPLGQPPDMSEPGSHRNARFGYEHQVRLEWTGQCRVRQILLYGNLKEEAPRTVYGNY